MPTIELGELTAASRPQPVGPDRAATGRPYRGRSLRPGLLVAVLVGLLGTMAAGSPVPRPWPEVTVPAPLGATVLTGRDLMFVAEPRSSERSRPELTAYRLPEVRPRWRVALPVDEVNSLLPVDDRLVLVSHPEPALARAGRLTVLDVATGAPVWDREAGLMEVSDGGDLLLWAAGGEDWRRTDSPGTLEAVDPASGAVRWSLPMPTGTLPSFEMSASGPTELARATNLVLALPSGRVEVRNLTTGAVVHAAQLPPPGAGPEPEWRAEVSAGLFLVYDESTVTAYGLPQLDRRWSVPVPPVEERGPFACGADLCSLRPQQGVRLWDTRTGGTRWADDRWTQVWAVGDALVATQGGGDETERISVLDPATGRELADLGSWALLAPHGSGLLGIRYGVDRRTWVYRFDPATWRSRLLTVLPAVSGDCGLAGTVLHCRRLDASIGLWRLPG